ncbi:MAG: M20/M25/M40 family metallo-hydrolase [Parvibaculaceae bacterium]
MHLSLDNIRNDTIALCRIGNRFAGSEGEGRARDHIRERMAAVGLENLRIDRFEVATYAPRRTECVLLGPSPRTLRCVGLQFTGSGTVEADVVMLGDLDGGADLETRLRDTRSLAGKIAVMKTSYPYLFVGALRERGVVGIVLLGDAPDGLCRNLNAMMYPALVEQPNGAHHPIPGVSLSAADSEQLLKHAAAGGKVKIVHEAAYPIVETGNVIGELAGTGAGAVVMGAHYDTQLDGVGASDNALGVSCMIEIARVLRARTHLRKIVAAAFADEEAGFRGSADYVRRYGQDLAATVGMVNLDALAWAPAARSLHADPAMMDYAAACADAVGWKVESYADASLFPGSDHNPFIDAGVPGAFFWRNPPTHPYYHTSGDSLDRIDFNVALDTARVIAHTVEKLANDETLPFDRSKPTTRWVDLRPRA